MLHLIFWAIQIRCFFDRKAEIYVFHNNVRITVVFLSFFLFSYSVSQTGKNTNQIQQTLKRARENVKNTAKKTKEELRRFQRNKGKTFPHGGHLHSKVSTLLELIQSGCLSFSFMLKYFPPELALPPLVRFEPGKAATAVH